MPWLARGPSLPASPDARHLRGLGAWSTGAAAEDIVARTYEGRGATVVARRWRSPAGELDLVLREGGTVVVVEVKKARTLDEAAHRLGRRQIARLCAAAALFCEGEPRGSLTDLRFDLALVDANGRVRILEGAWGEDW
jgi:putative endonuclease